MLKKIFSHSVIYSVGPQLPKIAGLFVLPLITPYLTSVDYGVQGLVSAYTGILSALSDLGMSIVMVNAFYKYPAKWPIIWKQIHGYLIIWSIFYALIQGLLLYLIIPKEAADNSGYIILLTCIPLAFFNTTLIFGSRFYQYSQKPLYIAFTTVIVGIATIICNYVTIAHFKLGYMGWFISSFLASFLLFLFYFPPIFLKYKLAPIFTFRKKFIIQKLKIALPTIPHDYSAYLVNTSDRVVFSILGIKISSQGQYNLAYIFGNYFEFFGNAVGMAISPFYVQLYTKMTDKGERDARTLTFIMQTIFIFLAFVISVWCKELLEVFIKNDELKNAYPLAIIIIMGYVYRPMYWASGIKISIIEQTSQLWKISFVSGILNLVLNFIFVPIYGVKAAAVTTFFALLYMGFAGFFLKAYKTSTSLKYYPLAWILIIIFISFCAYFIKDLTTQWKTVISCMAILGMCILYIKNRNTIKNLSL